MLPPNNQLHPGIYALRHWLHRRLQSGRRPLHRHATLSGTTFARAHIPPASLNTIPLSCPHRGDAPTYHAATSLHRARTSSAEAERRWVSVSSFPNGRRLAVCTVRRPRTAAACYSLGPRPRPRGGGGRAFTRRTSPMLAAACNNAHPSNPLAAVAQPGQDHR